MRTSRLLKHHLVNGDLDGVGKPRLWRAFTNTYLILEPHQFRNPFVKDDRSPFTSTFHHTVLL